MASRVSSFRFRSYDAGSAQTATRMAGCAGALSALPALSAALTVVYSLPSPGGVLNTLGDGWSFVDITLILALSYGTWRGNRFAATSLLVLYVAEQVVPRVSASNVSGLLVSGLFVVVFVQGMLGAFALHRLRPDDELEGSLTALEIGPDRLDDR